MNTKTVVLNAKKMNFDGKLDFSILSSEVVVYDDTTPEELLERIQDADVIVTKEMPVSGDLIRQFPDSVKLICEAGTGYNNLDLAAAKEKGIMVCNIPAYSTQRVAQTAIMLILNLSSAMQVQMAMLAKGNHDNFTKNLQVPHVEVNDKTLGIIGAGHIGREVIRIAKAMDMKILVYTRTPKEDGDGIRYVDLETLLRNSDYVSLHCPLTPQTRHMINKDTLAMMKPEAFLINTSRGALIDTEDLIAGIQARKFFGVGLDVYEEEGKNVFENREDVILENCVVGRLLSFPNVIVTSHQGFLTREALTAISRTTLQNAADFQKHCIREENRVSNQL